MKFTNCFRFICIQLSIDFSERFKAACQSLPNDTKPETPYGKHAKAKVLKR